MRPSRYETIGSIPRVADIKYSCHMFKTAATARIDSEEINTALSFILAIELPLGYLPKLLVTQKKAAEQGDKLHHENVA